MADVLNLIENKPTDSEILETMLARLPDGIDRNVGSLAYDFLAPLSIQFAALPDQTGLAMAIAFVETSYDRFLELATQDFGITRLPAEKATAEVTFTGASGTGLPLGTAVSTVSTANTPAVQFLTTEAATIPGAGAITVPVEATIAGADGNIGAGTITRLVTPIPGVTAVTNDDAASGGTDTEDDDSLKARYAVRVQDPSSSGNRGDYSTEALKVPGVGKVSVVPVWDGPGTVLILIVDDDGQAESQSIVDAVQDAIAPPFENIREAEGFTLSGFYPDDLGDDTGTSIASDPFPSPPDTADDTGFESVLQAPGVWRADVRAKLSAASVLSQLTVTVYNVTQSAIAKTRAGGLIDATVTINGADIETSFTTLDGPEFYWNGTDVLELQIVRLTGGDGTLWIDNVFYRSTFSTEFGDEFAPIGARVTCRAPEEVAANVAATLDLISGTDIADVEAAFDAAFTAYLEGIALESGPTGTDEEANDVRYFGVGNLILGIAGVRAINSGTLLINGVAADLVIDSDQIAVLGTTALTV